MRVVARTPRTCWRFRPAPHEGEHKCCAQSDGLPVHAPILDAAGDAINPKFPRRRRRLTFEPFFLKER